MLYFKSAGRSYHRQNTGRKAAAGG